MSSTSGEPAARTTAYGVLKRAADVALVLATLPVTLPTGLTVAALIRRRLGLPVLFRQPRPGLGGEPFEMVKFRTMTSERGADGALLPDADRLTPFGRFLRRTSLDELPELWNVLRGDMSLVGPRPLLTRYLPYYTAEELLRHSVRPGITGLAQVSGRNTVGWDRRLALDVAYARTVSAGLDFRILAKTALSVVRRDGVHDIPNAVMSDLDEERSAEGTNG